MSALLLILQFLKSNWKIILPVVLLIAALGYVKVLHMEIDHYKDNVIALQLQIDKAAVKEKELEKNATALSLKYSTSLHDMNQLVVVNNREVTKRIKNDQESKRIPISDNIISLFNDGKPALKLKDPPKAERGNDARTLSIEEDSRFVSDDEAGPQAYEHTLNELLDISNENDVNHLKCINTVHEWQKFWTDYVATYEAVANAP